MHLQSADMIWNGLPWSNAQTPTDPTVGVHEGYPCYQVMFKLGNHIYIIMWGAALELDMFFAGCCKVYSLSAYIYIVCIYSASLQHIFSRSLQKQACFFDFQCWIPSFKSEPRDPQKRAFQWRTGGIGTSLQATLNPPSWRSPQSERFQGPKSVDQCMSL